jgi:hypothetical protein
MSQQKQITNILKSSQCYTDSYCNFLTELGGTYQGKKVGAKYQLADVNKLYYELEELIFPDGDEPKTKVYFDLKENIGAKDKFIDFKFFCDIETADNYHFKKTDMLSLQALVVSILQPICNVVVSKIAAFVYTFNDKFPKTKFHIIFPDIIVNKVLRDYIYSEIKKKDPLLHKHIDTGASGLRCIWSTKVDKETKKWCHDKGRYCPPRIEDQHYFDYWKDYSLFSEKPLINLKSDFYDKFTSPAEFKSSYPEDEEVEALEGVDLDYLFMSYAQNVADEDQNNTYKPWRNNVWAIRSLGGTLKLAKKFSSLYKEYSEKATEDIWVAGENYKFSIGFVVNQLKKYHPTNYLEIMEKAGIKKKKRLLTFTAPKTHAKDISIHTHDDDYVQPYLPQKNIPVYMVQAGLGLGKTTQILHHINTLPKNSKIILLTSRISLAISLSGEIDKKCHRSFACYKDLAPEMIKNNNQLLSK